MSSSPTRAREDFLTFKLISLILFQFGNTTNLQFHLEKHHRHETDALTSNIENPERNGSTLNEYSNADQLQRKSQQQKNTKTKFNDLTLKFIVRKALPISKTDNEHF